MNEGITILADALASEGYVVLAPDAYRGRVTAQFPRALWLRLTTPEGQVFNDIDAALFYLMGLENVDPGSKPCDFWMRILGSEGPGAWK